MRLPLRLLIVAIALAGPGLRAEESAGGPDLAFGAVDLDRNGELSPEEFLQHRARSLQLRFAGMDRNRDGSLSPGEIDPARRASEARLHRLAPEDPRRAEFESMPDFADMDQNQDGRIDADEFAAAQKASLLRRFARLDTDGNGALSAAEFEAARDRFLRMLAPRRPGRPGEAGPASAQEH
jgi:Ca2+-binding EF-hand superfamily protein